MDFISDSIYDGLEERNDLIQKTSSLNKCIQVNPSDIYEPNEDEIRRRNFIRNQLSRGWLIPKIILKKVQHKRSCNEIPDILSNLKNANEEESNQVTKVGDGSSNLLELGHSPSTLSLLSALKEGLLGPQIRSEYESCGKTEKSHESLPPISKPKTDDKLPPGLSILPFKILPSIDATDKCNNNMNSAPLPDVLKAIIPSGYSLIKTSRKNQYCFRKQSAKFEDQNGLQAVSEEFVLDSESGVLVNKDGNPLQLPIMEYQQEEQLIPLNVNEENNGGHVKALFVLPGGQMVLTQLRNEQIGEQFANLSVIESGNGNNTNGYNCAEKDSEYQYISSSDLPFVKSHELLSTPQEIEIPQQGSTDGKLAEEESRDLLVSAEDLNK